MLTENQKPTPGVSPWVFMLVGIVVAVAIGWKIMDRPAIVEVTPGEPLVRRAIDGVWVPEGTLESYPLAVVIENSIDAWPISGIAEANLVWEAPTEAGITRFLAIFGDGEIVEKIGPVRSIRPYFIDWASERYALLAHVGGSPEALALARKEMIIDLNEFWNGSSFWRDTNRARPHNVYTSTTLLRDAFAKTPPNWWGGEMGDGLYPNLDLWKYQDEAIRENRGQAQEITVVFGNPVYTVTWQYDPETNEYIRVQRGVFYHDANGTIVRAKNVVVMQTEIEILDEIGRRKIKTIGNGPVHVFRDGQEITGEWRQQSTYGTPTRFYDIEQREIALNPGTTWVLVTDLEPVTR